MIEQIRETPPIGREHVWALPSIPSITSGHVEPLFLTLGLRIILPGVHENTEYASPPSSRTSWNRCELGPPLRHHEQYRGTVAWRLVAHVVCGYGDRFKRKPVA